MVLVYAATPLRMNNLTDIIGDYITCKNQIPFQPLLAFPPERFNYKNYSREIMDEICFRMVDACDELWIFGIGGGSLREYTHAKAKGKSIHSLVKIFDPQWEEWSNKEKYRTTYKEVVEEVLRLSEV